MGKQNSTEEELRAYLDGYRRELDRRAGADAAGISKVSVQTGTIAWRRAAARTAASREVKLDFGDPRAARRAWPANTAWRALSSTVPRRCRDELFHRFPDVETAEIHLATGFQNALYEHPDFPPTCSADIERGASPTRPTSASDGRDRRVFLYKTRKKALGPFKRQLWELPTKD